VRRTPRGSFRFGCVVTSEVAPPRSRASVEAGGGRREVPARGGWGKLKGCACGALEQANAPDRDERGSHPQELNGCCGVSAAGDWRRSAACRAREVEGFCSPPPRTSGLTKETGCACRVLRDNAPAQVASVACPASRCAPRPFDLG
jgi:hypothetical protein